MDNLLRESIDINQLIFSVVDCNEIHIVRTLLYCKYILEIGEDEANKIWDNLYERCEKYLEESKKYVSPEYVNKYLKSPIGQLNS